MRSTALRLTHATLVTAHDGTTRVQRDASVLMRRGCIVAVGPAAHVERAIDATWDVETIDLQHALVTPGLVDCHTHLVYGGDRTKEHEQRLAGVSYEAIARAGGGIQSTVRATRATSTDALFDDALRRARTLLDGGVTTVEIKSGYGLSLEHETRCLEVARRIGLALPITVHATCLAAHAVGPEFERRPDDYIDAVCDWLPTLHARGLIDSVDAFCERIGFTVDQTRRVFEAAQALGLPIRLHAEQLSWQGGAELAASMGALSCDHVEYLRPETAESLRRAGTVAVLLPGAWFVVGDPQKPPTEALRRAGVPMAIATDHNPGTSPTLSLILMAQMACRAFGLSVDEALLGITCHAAQALGRSDLGRVLPGARADLAVWDAETPAHLLTALGATRPLRVLSGGREVER
jgi:imidazolonepropionase